jgi:hypothetical protein
MVSCARAWFYARVHGGVRAYVPACVCMCVPARVRPSRFTKLYRNTARHILILPHTHCNFYRTTRQNYIFSVRACAVASVLRAYTVACAIAWFCARVHGCVRACVRASINILCTDPRYRSDIYHRTDCSSCVQHFLFFILTQYRSLQLIRHFPVYNALTPYTLHRSFSV